MKLFVCQSCQQLLYFENSQCVRCGHELGFLPEITWLSALEPAGGESWTALAAPGRSWRRCANAVHGSCNWMVPADADTPFCVACRHNRTIPDLTVPENLEAWQRLEIAKHRLFYTLLKLRLPLITKAEDEATGLAFDFMADPVDPNAPKVMTGHDDGLITIALVEADDVERERRRVKPLRAHEGRRRRALAEHRVRENGGAIELEIVLAAGNAQLDARQRQADQARARRRVGRQAGAGGAGLGHAPAAADAQAEQLL